MLAGMLFRSIQIAVIMAVAKRLTLRCSARLNPRSAATSIQRYRESDGSRLHGPKVILKLESTPVAVGIGNVFVLIGCRIECATPQLTSTRIS